MEEGKECCEKISEGVQTRGFDFEEARRCLEAIDIEAFGPGEDRRRRSDLD